MMFLHTEETTRQKLTECKEKILKYITSLTSKLDIPRR